MEFAGASKQAKQSRQLNKINVRLSVIFMKASSFSMGKWIQHSNVRGDVFIPYAAIVREREGRARGSRCNIA